MTDDQRTLVFETPNWQGTWNAVTHAFETSSNINADWQQLGPAQFFYESTIDLSGYSLQHKTLYPYTSFSQLGGTYAANYIAVLTEQPYVCETNIISSVPLSSDDVFAALFNSAPGFLGYMNAGTAYGYGTAERTNIIHGEVSVYTVDSNTVVPGANAYVRLFDKFTFSSLEPTASDTLYCYRALYFIHKGDEVQSAIAPPLRVLLPSTIGEEPQKEYLMRLKRSYELANQ